MENKVKLVTPKMREGGFIRLRDGIWEHIAQRRITPYDLAVYLTLLKWANYRTGVCTTTAASIASNWGDWGSLHEVEGESETRKSQRKKRTVQTCLHRMKSRGYIGYKEGGGKRGAYPILIDKYEPPLGVLMGWSLCLSETTDYKNPVYEYVSPTPFEEAYGKVYSEVYSHMHENRMVIMNAEVYTSSACDCTPDGHLGVHLTVPFQDIYKMYQDIKITRLQDCKIIQDKNLKVESKDEIEFSDTISFNLNEDDQ